jgi:hypothetical protein
VVDEEGAAIPGAWIEIRRHAEGQPRETVLADQVGRATLRVGRNEELVVGARGFSRVRVPKPVEEVVLPRSYAIAGVVVDGAGEEIADAALTLEEPFLPSRTGASGPDGRFAFEDVAGEEMVLRASAEGRTREMLLVAPGDTRVRVVLWKPVSVSGVVVFPDARPGAGAKVNGVPAGADGGFVVPGVRPGRVELLASLRMPGATWSARASVGVAADGTHDPVRLVLEQAPRSWVNVRVLEGDAPVAGVPVRSPLLDAVYPRTDASGRVTLVFDRPAGTPTCVEVDQKRDDGLFAGKADAVTGPLDGPEVVLRARVPFLVTVTVRMPDGSPLHPDLEVTFGVSKRVVRRERDAVTIELDPADTKFQIGFGAYGFVDESVWLPVPADARAELRLQHRTGGLECRLVSEPGAAVRDGFVRAWLKGVGSGSCEEAEPDGVYRIEEAPEGAVVVTAGFEHRLPLVRMEAEIRAGETTDLGTIVLHAPRTVAGRVTDAAGRPVGGARVSAGEQGAGWETYSRSDGSYRLVVPAWFDGRVVASKPGYGTVHRPAAAAADLVLASEGRVRLEVRIPPGVSRGWSLEARDPATGFQWHVRDRQVLEGTTYLVKGLPPGRVILVVGASPKDGEVEVLVVADAVVPAVVHVPE